MVSFTARIRISFTTMISFTPRPRVSFANYYLLVTVSFTTNQGGGYPCYIKHTTYEYIVLRCICIARVRVRVRVSYGQG